MGTAHFYASYSFISHLICGTKFEKHHCRVLSPFDFSSIGVKVPKRADYIPHECEVRFSHGVQGTGEHRAVIPFLTGRS